MRENYLYKKNNYEIEKFNLFSFDTENNPDTGEFICGGVFNPKFKTYFTDMEKFENYILSLDKVGNKITAFNLTYDEYALRDIVNDSKILRNESRVIKIALENTDIIDIQNISGTERGYSLAYWMNILDLEKKYGIKKVDFSDIKLRVMNDAAGTYYLSDFIQNYFNEQWHITLKDTIGACALESYRCNYLPYNLFRQLENDLIPDFERKGLRGGRNEIFIRGDLDVISYDVRSMYVSVMRDNFLPIPNKCRMIEGVDDYEKYYNRYLCLMDVKVKVPYSKVCPLPVWAKIDNVYKVIYPYGIFRGIYTSEELKNAERYGTEIIECYNMIYYYQKDKIFSKFASDIWQLRMKHNRRCIYNCPKCSYTDVKQCPYSFKNPDYNKALDTMNKKVGNSTYGKMSQHIPIVSFYGREKHLPEEYREYLKDNENFNVSLYEYNDELYIDLHSKKKVDSRFTFPVISTFITSYARIKLFNAVYPVREKLVYVDTDSAKILNEDGYYIEHGNDLGDFAEEYHKKEPFYAPKFYGTKTKGIDKDNVRIIQENLEDGFIEYEIKRPWKFKSAIRRNKVMALWEFQSKTASLKDDKRVWYGKSFYNQGTNSKPYYINTGDKLDIIINTSTYR